MKKTLSLLVFIPLMSLAAKSKAENLADLKSADDAIAIKAAQELGNDGVKDAIEPLGELVKSKRAAGVRIAAASALGRMDVKGRPTTILREAIEADQDNQVIYTELLALMNLKDIKNEDLKKAIEYCENNKKSDPFIADILVRIRKVFTKEEKKDAPAEPKPAATADKPADKPAEPAPAK